MIIQVFVLALLAGINLSLAVLSVFIFTQSGRQRIYAYFGIFSLFSGLYFFFGSINYFYSGDLSVLAIFCAAIYYSIFPWFISALISRQWNWIKVLPVIFGLAFLFFLTDYSIGSLPVWQIIAHVGLIGLIIHLLLGIKISVSSKMVNRTEFIVLSVLFVTLAIEEMATTYFGFPNLSKVTYGILPLDLYPIFFSLIMGYRIGQDVLDRFRYKLQTTQKDLEIQQLRVQEAEKQKLELQLKYKRKDLTDLSLELIRRKEFTMEVHSKLKVLKSKLGVGASREVDEVLNFTKSNVMIDNSIENIIGNVDRVNHEFYSKVRSNYPDLSDNDLQLVALLRLNLGTKEMAAIKHVEPNSIKIQQYRLRKKLKLDSKVSLRKFFSEL